MFLFEKQNMENSVVLLGQFQSSSMGSRTKATLALPALVVQMSHVCHDVNIYPKDLSLLFIRWWVFSEAEEAGWHCVFTDYPKRNTHIGLMRIRRWEKAGGAWSSSRVGHLCEVPCGDFRGSTLSLLQKLCLFYLCLSQALSLWFLPRG